MYSIKNPLNIITVLIAFCILFSISPTESFAGYPGAEQIVISAVEKVEPAVVNVKSFWTSGGRTKEGYGSGVIISKQGWVITNAHVIKNAKKIYITLNDGRVFSALSWRADSNEDIAVIKIPPKNLPVASIGDSGKLKKGQIAIAIGNPWKFKSTVTVGCVSGIGRNIEAGSRKSSIKFKNLVQTDAAINPGNSGGALVNSSGQVIGINTLVYTGLRGDYAQGLSFAIPINHAMNVARRLIGSKSASRMKPWLGVQVSNVKPGMKLKVKSGVVVLGFPPKSPARDAGLRPGDVIVSINQVPVLNTRDMMSVFSRLKIDDIVVIGILRGNRRMSKKVKLEGMRE